jgi:hypothetical protein
MPDTAIIEPTVTEPPESDEQIRARIEAMSPYGFKLFVNKLRRKAAIRGWRLTRSRARDPKHPDWHGFKIVEVRTRRILLGRQSDGRLPDILSVEQFLT